MTSYTRVYSDDFGESHFEDVEIDLTLTEYAPAAPPLELSSITPARNFGFMNTPAGWSSDWHQASARNIFFVLTGEWEVTASDGETRRFGVGSVLLPPASCYKPANHAAKEPASSTWGVRPRPRQIVNRIRRVDI